MDKSTTPFGENDMWQSAHKKIFELATASPAYFFVHISPHLILSNSQDIVWRSNNLLCVCLAYMQRWLKWNTTKNTQMTR